jgi:hypothetical protein
VLTTTSITAVSVSTRIAQETFSVAGVDPAEQVDDLQFRPSEPKVKKATQDRSAAGSPARGDIFGRLGADGAAEQAGDQRADQRQEEDCVNTSAPQPFIMLTSSTAMEPRFR